MQPVTSSPGTRPINAIPEGWISPDTVSAPEFIKRIAAANKRERAELPEYPISNHHLLVERLVDSLARCVNSSAALRPGQQEEASRFMLREVAAIIHHVERNWGDYLLSLPLVQPDKVREIATFINGCSG